MNLRPRPSWSSCAIIAALPTLLVYVVAGRYFTGTMDEIALYDRVLDASEVHAHAKSQLPIVFWCLLALPGQRALNGVDHARRL